MKKLMVKKSEIKNLRQLASLAMREMGIESELDYVNGDKLDFDSDSSFEEFCKKRIGSTYYCEPYVFIFSANRFGLPPRLVVASPGIWLKNYLEIVIEP